MKMLLRTFSSMAIMLQVTGAIAQTKVAKISVTASINCDHCNKCQSCGGRLKNAVYREKGVRKVEVDEQNKVVMVTFNSEKTSPEIIRQAIAKVGYDADDVKGDPAAYDKLDDCCKAQ